MQQVSLENEGLGVNPVSSPGRGLSGEPSDVSTAELLRISNTVLRPTSSRDRCWNPCLLTASAQELGAQTAVTAHACGKPSSLRGARGLWVHSAAQRSPACFPSPREERTHRLATFILPLSLLKELQFCSGQQNFL